MIAPAYLQKGDKIGIIAPARWMTEVELKPALELFARWELIPVVGEHVYDQFNQLAGSDKQRANDFQKMLDDPDIKAIICARGGYGSIRVLPLLNFSNFKHTPKWVVGYSDVSVFHSYINSHLGFETIHATMPVMFPSDGPENQSLISLKKALFGERIKYNVTPNDLNRPGKSKACLVGGNLSVLYSLAGTPYDIDAKDKILFIEDVDEYLYHIDRMMMNLKLTGKLKQIRGLIIGGMSDMHDNQVIFGKSANEIISEAANDYSFPVTFDFPAGHIPHNNAFYLGREIEMNVTENGSCIEF